MNRDRSFIATAFLTAGLLLSGWSCHPAATAPVPPPQPVAAAPAPPPQPLPAPLPPVVAVTPPQEGDVAPPPPPPPVPTTTAEPPLQSGTGAAIQHDTPIIIQGGSLLVWSKKPFNKDTGTKRVITPIEQTVSLIREFKDGNVTEVTRTYSIPPDMQGSWAVCAKKPHYVRIADLGTSEIAMTSWDKYTGKDVFSDEPADDKYPYKQRHRESGKLQGLYFGQGACKAIERASKGNCSTDLHNSPCLIDCPSGRCWIGLGY